MPRNTRILGFIQSPDVKPGALAPDLVILLGFHLFHNSIPGVITEGLADGCIGIDTTEEASFKVTADNYNFAERLKAVLSVPEIRVLNFSGEFTLVTDGYPLPYVMHVGVQNSVVYASKGNIGWGEMILVEGKDNLKVVG